MTRLRLSAILLLFLCIGAISFSQAQDVIGGPLGKGKWGPVIDFEIVPVALANLPDGRLVAWSSKYHDNFGGKDGHTYTQIFDPYDGEDGKAVSPSLETDTNHDMFCPGINNLADGRIMVTGGSSDERTSIFDPRTEKWTRGPDLKIARGYQGAVTLSNGSVFTIGGSWSGGPVGGRTAEIWTEALGWKVLTGLPSTLLYNANDMEFEREGVYRLDNHAWLWAAPNGKIFHAGPGEMMHWIDVNDDNGNGAYVEVGPRGDDEMSMNGNSVMFDIGKILKVGGSVSYDSEHLSNEKAYIIDINNENSVTVTRTGNVNKARVYVSSVVLPSGEVLILGGMGHSKVFSDSGAHLAAEMFNPTSNSFRPLAKMTIPRTYHSAGILLSDGRVFIGGGGLCGRCNVNHTDGQVYSPPYLFDNNGILAKRPELDSPDMAFYGQTLPVVASSNVHEFAFVRMSSATHSVNNEQRRIPITNVSEVDGVFQVPVPQAEVMPPGYYMLFAIDINGVPSISKTVLVGPSGYKLKEDNLLVEFDFFEGSGSHVTDISGKNNHGTIKERTDAGLPVTPLSAKYWSKDGLSGNALEMNGLEHLSNTLLEISSTPQLRAALTNQITVMAWVNRNIGSIVPIEPPEIPNVSIFAHDYPRSFFMGYHDSQFKVEFHTTASGPLGHFNGYTGISYTPGEWEHFVSTYDGSIAKVYVNGEQVFEQNVSGNLLITNQNNPFSNFTLSGFYDRRSASGVGLLPYANRSGITDELDGRMDKFKLYNVALTEAEIKNIYSNESDVVLKTGPCDDVVLSYEVNGSGKKRAKEISVLEGDNVSLFLDPEILDYTITGSGGNVLSSNVMENITLGQSDIYTVHYLLKEISVVKNVTLQAVSSAMGGSHKRPGTLALDNRPDTMWHTPWNPDVAGPHYIDLDLGVETIVAGLEYLPRQGDILNGTIADWEIYVSNSPSVWGNPVQTGTWAYNHDLKEVELPIRRGRYVRLRAMREGGGNKWASAAEIRVLTAVVIPCEKTIKINVQRPTTYTFEGTWSPSDPNGSSKIIDDFVVNSGDAIISQNTLSNKVTINPGASLTINESINLTANKTTLNSTSTAFASFIHSGYLIGEVEYNRFVNKIGTEAGGGNDLISSPIDNAVFNAAFVNENSELARHRTEDGIYAFAPYNVENGAYENFNIGLGNSGSSPILPGVGYRVATINDDIPGFKGASISFKGSVTKNSIDIAVSDAPAGKAWNLIGNPYPAYLDFEMFFTENSDKFDSREAYQAIYGYTGASNVWTIWNLATIAAAPNGFPQIIAPGQGFFIKSKSGGALVKFTPEMRTVGSTDDFILGRNLNGKVALSKLKLRDRYKEAVTSIYFIDGTTRGLDAGYDAGAFTGAKVDFSVFTNLVEDHTGQDIAIQSLPYDDFNDVVVPLGLKAKVGAELTISIDELSTIPSNVNVYLEDTQSKTLTLLNKGDFTFNPTSDLNSADRFNIHYSSKTLSIDDMDISDNLRVYTTVMPRVLMIRGQLTSATVANLYDIQGRLVLSNILNSNTIENTIDISKISTGVYVIKLSNDNQFKTQKVIIK